ncbi:hypothetical protein RMSM_02251 [Rhodopirellula maiorica SM1]|uniref:Uncharacterized protein n=1 Tax=Rhodopirellula maiorica SM1 TaxID=1265738 RepID=M5RZK8_9BACT|nr:hypothetical protein RMSM_02251 [Rhodopirellula maiorica SM1]
MAHPKTHGHSILKTIVPISMGRITTDGLGSAIGLNEATASE